MTTNLPEYDRPVQLAARIRRLSDPLAAMGQRSAADRLQAERDARRWLAIATLGAFLGLTGAIANGVLSPPEPVSGPIVIIVSNQTASEQTVTLETEELGGSQPGLKQSTDPISPRGTGTLKADVREGSYAISVRKGPEPATVEVGPKRKSAQDTLLEP